VNLKERIQGLQIDVRYHGSDNFTGAPLPGYGAPGAWLLEEAAEALKHVQADLEPQGYGLLVYDAYRPKRGTRGMVAWAERTDQLHLFKQGYIARHSGHNHGHTVDLTLVKLENGAAVDMGTPWDTLSSASHTRNATGAALDHRLLLKRAMEARGFAYYYKEWWHFSFPMEGTRPRDVPYGCFEAAEGAWTPLPEWNSVAFQMPTDWPDTPCPSDQPIK